MMRSVSITRMVGLLMNDAVLSACMEAATKRSILEWLKFNA